LNAAGITFIPYAHGSDFFTELICSKDSCRSVHSQTHVVHKSYNVHNNFLVPGLAISVINHGIFVAVENGLPTNNGAIAIIVPAGSALIL
jgi:hypothetical protein